MKKRIALTIAGSDSGGGAGIQADIKTMTVNGVFAASAVTALTTDLRPDAVKIGMVSSAALIETIADKLTEYGADHVVVDPVMVATSGARLISEEAVGTLKERLLPLAEVITPNIPEAEVLSDMEIHTPDDMTKDDANDLLYKDGEAVWFNGRRIDNPNTHGTGCTLSSAIAANLAKGFDLEESVRRAKEYISGALAAMLDLGEGRGPMDHAFDVKGKFTEGACR